MLKITVENTDKSSHPYSGSTEDKKSLDSADTQEYVIVHKHVESPVVINSDMLREEAESPGLNAKPPSKDISEEIPLKTER